MTSDRMRTSHVRRSMSERRGRLHALHVTIVAVGLLLSGLASPSSASAQPADPAQQLADKYAPVLMLKQQEAACDYAGEGYFPAAVDWLMSNPDVRLKAVGDGDDADNDPVLKTAPTLQDLVTAGPDTYLDFPGDPRNPGCGYEQYFKQQATELGLQPTIYAKYVYAPTDRRLYLEYWFYYFFNDWNNTHESDWEMIALGFDAETPEQALSLTPSWVGYSQHGGGETAHWGDEKLSRDGDHPIAYPSAGSHATYYTAETMIGWGENGSAFGCDVTTPPSTEIRPTVVVVPDLVDANGPFAWTLYQGHWGQREVSMFSGPKGPNLGKKWNDPAAAFENWRTSTLTVPSSDTLGVNTTDFFCRVSETVSRAAVYYGSHPWLVGISFAAVLVLIGFLIWRGWAYFAEALDVYGNELRTFLGIGLFAVPIGLLFNALRIWASDVPPLEWVQAYFNDTNGGKLTATLLVIVLQQLAMLLVISPAIIFALSEIRQGIKPGVWHSYVGGFKNFGSLVGPLAILVLAMIALSWTVILIPVAIYLLVRWQFFSQAVILDGERGLTRSLGKSWEVTSGRWWLTLVATLAFQLLGSLPGPVIGVVMLIIGGSDVKFANAVSSILYAAFVPLAVIGITLVYRRLKGEAIIEPHMSTRERDAGKAERTRAAREEAIRRAGLGATG
jgi:hypothetical protein